MVLGHKFPENSEKRASLILQLKTDVQGALATVSKAIGMDIINLEHGSVIAHFRFVTDNAHDAAFLEEDTSTALQLLGAAAVRPRCVRVWGSRGSAWQRVRDATRARVQGHSHRAAALWCVWPCDTLPAIQCDREDPTYTAGSVR